MTDNKIGLDEAQRAANYEALKTGVQSNVDNEIAARANAQSANVENVAANMHNRAVNEIVQTENEVERGRFAARISQIVDYVFFLIYGLLTIRLLLELFAARENAGFVKFIKSATGIFYAPFAGIVPSLSQDGFKLALPIIVAIVAYMVLHLAINGILRIIAHRKTTV